MKKVYFKFTLIVLLSLNISAQVADELLPFTVNNYPKISDWHIAVFPIDFTDIPAQYRSNFPTKTEWSQKIFQGDISTWYQDMSYGTTTITGDVFDYTTSSEVFFDITDNSIISVDQILGSIDFQAPGFDINAYDYVVFITCHDAAVHGSITTNKTFKINGVDYTQSVVATSYQNGIWHRNSGMFLENDQLTDSNQYFIPTATDTAEEGDVSYTMSKFETILLHELGHSMGLDNHANSSTNGNLPAHISPEGPNNGSLLNNNYGNKFDIMGDRDYGIGMNGAMRDFCGLIDASTIYSKNWWGKTTVTIAPVSSASGNRFVEILLPDERDFFGYKNHGYALEIKTASDYNTMLTNPELSNNIDGFFVHKIAGTEDLLLDMSPSANINYFGDYLPDIRDVVLKQGMTYDNDDILLENVVDNGDGTWSIDITIKADLIVTPAPNFNSAVRQGNGDIIINWVNNCGDCGVNELFIISYRKIGDASWSDNYDADLTLETHTITALSGSDEYEFRGSITSSATHYSSLYSNTVSTTLGVEDYLENKIKFYPNPSSDILHVNLSEITKISVFNSLGKKIMEVSNSNTINIKSFSSGVYFVKVLSEGKIYQSKIIKK